MKSNFGLFDTQVECSIYLTPSFERGIIFKTKQSRLSFFLNPWNTGRRLSGRPSRQIVVVVERLRDVRIEDARDDVAAALGRERRGRRLGDGGEISLRAGPEHTFEAQDE